MKRFFSVFVMLAIVGMAASGANAAGFVKVYFDEELTATEIHCPGAFFPGAGKSVLYVVAEDVNDFVIAFDYKINLPANMTWNSDFDMPTVTIGTTVTGVSSGFSIPQIAFGKFVIGKINVTYNDCFSCNAGNEAGALHTVESDLHPIFNAIQYVSWPLFELKPLSTASNSVTLLPKIAQADADQPGANIGKFPIRLIKGGSLNEPPLPEEAPGTNSSKETFWITGTEGGPDGLAVADINLSTVRVNGVAPQSTGFSYGDVSSPRNGTGFFFAPNCTFDARPTDGIDDLSIKVFSAFMGQGITGDHEVGDIVPIHITGQLNDGCEFEAWECVELSGPAGSGQANVIGSPVLKPAVPNPFNPVTRISFSLPSSGNVKLSIYDVAGRLVEVLDEGVRSAGDYTFEWNAGGLASGVYFYRLEAEGQTFTKRATLLK